MKPRVLRSGMAIVLLVLASGVASAQDTASITGTVTDITGSVLPGVTVVASSPALIEGSRTVVTDGSGLYRVVALRPGIYEATFTLPGFSTVVREGIELGGAFTASVDVELSVGSVQETVTVSGATPIVDVQNVQQQEVMSRDVVDALPSGRTPVTLGVLVPSISMDSLQAVGGTNMLETSAGLNAHGGKTTDFRLQVDGFGVGSTAAQQSGIWIPNMGAAQEIGINVNQAGSAEATQNGVVLNVISREGGNTFEGSFYATGATEDWQSDNFTQRVQDRGLSTGTKLVNTYDMNLSGGGPIVRDRLWFYASVRSFGYQTNPGGIFFNQNALIRDNWTYVADLDRPATDFNYSRDFQARLTWQASEKHKFTFGHEMQIVCRCKQVGTISGFARAVGLQIAPESAGGVDNDNAHWMALTWTAPITNRVLLQGGVLARKLVPRLPRRPPEGDPLLDLINVWDFSNGLVFHGQQGIAGRPYAEFGQRLDQARASLSYVTGSHSLKVGVTLIKPSTFNWEWDNNFNMTYVFANFRGRGSEPVQLFQRATPYFHQQTGWEVGLYAQDTWTIDRLTLNLGLRFDRYTTAFDDHYFGPTRHIPDRDFTVPGGDWHNFKDFSPRIGAAYDLFGNGRTALKFSANKALTNPRYLSPSNPAATVLHQVGRTWIDNNGNRVPDCDLSSPASQFGADICGARDPNFGLARSAANVDETTYRGWGNRDYNWEFSGSVQHELAQGISLDVGYFRRIYGNFVVTEDRAVDLSDFDQFSVAAPADERLPGGGGYEVGPILDLKEERVGYARDLFLTFANNFGAMYQHWNGVDATVSARLENGLLLAGGTSTGRTSMNDCDVAPALADDAEALLYCDTATNFLTNVKAYGAYTIPTVDVQLSVTYQNLPGPAVQANVLYSSADVAGSLGRPLSGGAATISVEGRGRNGVAVIEPGSWYGERINQLDLRIGKLFRFDQLDARLNFDIFNALNSDTILREQPNYGVEGALFRNATALIQGRLMQISMQLDF